MPEHAAESSILQTLINEILVLDTASPYVIIGTFMGEDAHYLILENADVHDLRDSPTTRELYVVETRRLGVRSNRKRAFVRKSDVISLSKLDDILA